MGRGGVRARRILAPLAVIVMLALVVLVALSLYLMRTTSVRSNWPLPLEDRLAYPAHAALGITLNQLGASPTAAAIQWVKAAAHASSDDQVAQAAGGLAVALLRATEGERLESRLCPDVLQGRSPTQLAAVQSAGLRCDADEFNLSHRPDGQPIQYETRPPRAGPHYSARHPTYGVVEELILPGHWVHNLEHGAVVLLYRCPEGCPELVAQLAELYASLPTGRNTRPEGGARLLVTPYDDMDRRIAVVAWGHVLELDQLDRRQIIAFYEDSIDRGPECRNFSCPE